MHIDVNAVHFSNLESLHFRFSILIRHKKRLTTSVLKQLTILFFWNPNRTTK